MSSNGVKVKQQLFCVLKILIKNEKGTPFSLPAISRIDMRLLNTRLPGEIKMLQENKVSSEILDT